MSDASLRETAIELSAEAASLLRCDSLEAAPALLGAVITVADSAGRVAIRLTEVEAYRGEKDPGSHAFRGRTARNASMFEWREANRLGRVAPQPALTATWPVARPDCAPHWDWTAPTTAHCWAGRDHASA